MPSTGSSNPQLENVELLVRPLRSVVLDETVHITIIIHTILCLNALREYNLAIVLNCYHFDSKDASAETNIPTSCLLKNLLLWSSLQLTCDFFVCYSFYFSLTSYFFLLYHCSRYFSPLSGSKT